ncbi:CCD86 protein, partial [Bucco capensis]|nr:CCD86 protein [Bucco capensis]
AAVCAAPLTSSQRAVRAAWSMELSGEAPGQASGPEQQNGAAPGPTTARRPRKAGKNRKEAVVPIPRGRPKSGRVWKDPGKKRWARGRVTGFWGSAGLRGAWKAAGGVNPRACCVLLLQEKQQRREQNLKRRQENERRAEIVQVIRNPVKLKRAKKKLLRRVEKRDTLALLQKTPVHHRAAKQ